MSVSVLGSGAFGTALAISLARKGPVTLWARSADHVAQMRSERRNDLRLPGIPFPPHLTVTASIEDATQPDIVLLAVPMQSLGGVLEAHRDLLARKSLVACCKGIDLSQLTGPSALIAAALPLARAAILTGPSFAADIARGLPTALTLACSDPDGAKTLQQALTTDTLRLYRTTDTVGADLGGALKNVIAIACGVVMGAGLGESARAALLTRGFAEIVRLGAVLGAEPRTLSGLCGLGDLVLTCTSTQSRNYRHGLAIGQGGSGVTGRETVEGVATALAAARLADKYALDLPVTATVAALVEDRIDVGHAITALMTRPLKEE